MNLLYELDTGEMLVVNVVANTLAGADAAVAQYNEHRQRLGKPERVIAWHVCNSFPNYEFADAYRGYDIATRSPTVDMPLARGIVTERTRHERNARLVVLDIEHRKAAGDLAKETEINLTAQKLRDFPVTIQSELAQIQTADALSLWTPTWPDTTA